MEDLVLASEQDLRSLESAGFDVRKVERDAEWSKPVSFRKAHVSRGDEKVELDWAHDSAFRFFQSFPMMCLDGGFTFSTWRQIKLLPSRLGWRRAIMWIWWS